MCPGSPRSTLVPYTTLFRSAALGGGRVRAGGLPAAEPRPLGGHGRPGLRGRAARADPAARRAGAAGATPPGPDRVLRGLAVGDRRGGGARHGHRDRKSTRLNSSHVAISYAVFCL